MSGPNDCPCKRCNGTDAPEDVEELTDEEREEREDRELDAAIERHYARAMWNDYFDNDREVG